MKSPLLTNFKRFETLWGLLLVAGMANGLMQLSRIAIERFDGLTPVAGLADLSQGGRRTLLAYTAAMGIGMVLNGVVQEMWTTDALRTARGIGARLWREFVMVAVGFFTLVVAIAAAATGGDLGAALAWPLVPLGMWLGLVVFEPLVIGWGTTLAIGALIGLGFGVEWVGTLQGVPLVAATAGALALLFATLKAMTQKAYRDATLKRQLDGGVSVHSDPLDIAPWERALRKHRLPDARWTGGPVRTRDQHLAALDFERWGWAPRGWPLGRLGFDGAATLLVGQVVLAALALAALSSDPARTTLDWLAELLGRPSALTDAQGNHMTRHWFAANIYACALFAALLVVNDRMLPGLRSGRLYPHSRQTRAELIARGSRQAWQKTGLVLLAVSTALWLAATLAAGAPLGPEPPAFAIAFAAAAATLPLYQLVASLRETRTPKPPAPWVNITWMIVGLSAACSVMVLLTLGILGLGTLPAWLAVVALAATVPVGQGLFRRYLVRRFATLELR